MESLKLKNGLFIPRLGQGTWHMGEKSDWEQTEIEALRLGIDLGLTLIDTAEMYGEGGAEKVVGKAIAPYAREELFLVSKVYPYNAGGAALRHSCEGSLRRLGTDYLDLYLLHWPGTIPLETTIAGMEKLVGEGKIRSWGVSNFETTRMERLLRCRDGKNCVTDQVLYHLGSRGTDYDLAPFLIRNEMVLMAYCPVAQGGRLREALMRDPLLRQIAHARDISVMQLLLAFVLSRPNTVAIPKAATSQHIKENADARNIHLSAPELAAIEEAYPPPDHPQPLDIQ